MSWKIWLKLRYELTEHFNQPWSPSSAQSYSTLSCSAYWKVYLPILWEFLLILSFQETLFLSETLEKITFNPGLSGKLLLILENELETSPSSSLPELQRHGTRCWWWVGAADFELNITSNVPEISISPETTGWNLQIINWQFYHSAVVNWNHEMFLFFQSNNWNMSNLMIIKMTRCTTR